MQHWTIEFSSAAQDQFLRLDYAVRERILRYLRQRIAGAVDPTQYGKPLRAPLQGLWRYRVDDYRVICQIHRGRFLVVVVKVGHRSRVYD